MPPRGSPRRLLAPPIQAQPAPVCPISMRKIPQQPEQLRFDRRESSPPHGRARMNYDVPSREDLQNIAPKDFADAAADSIAHHRASNRFFHADAKPAARSAVSAIKNHKLRRRSSPTSAIDCLEFGAAYQTRCAKRKFLRRTRSFKWA